MTPFSVGCTGNALTEVIMISRKFLIQMIDGIFCLPYSSLFQTFQKSTDSGHDYGLRSINRWKHTKKKEQLPVDRPFQLLVGISVGLHMLGSSH